MDRLIKPLSIAASLACARRRASACAADAAFTQWLAALWPQAQQVGRTTRSKFQAPKRPAPHLTGFGASPIIIAG
jgi:hypothetical protein